MAKIVENYPLLTKDNLPKIFGNCFFDLEYKKDSWNYNELKYEEIEKGSNKYLVDSNGTWSPDTFGLRCKGEIVLKNLYELFGANAIVDYNSTIGVNINYYSKPSKISFTKEIGEFNSRTECASFEYEFEFEENVLREKINVEIGLFLKNNPNNETLFAKKRGSNLGTLYSFELSLEGSGSIFPIRIIEDDTKPLWTMSLNYDSLLDDFSVENICIKLNKMHKDFKKIGSDTIDATNYLLWKEILSSFFSNLLIYSKNEFDEYSVAKYPDGSIGKFLFYTVSNFNISKNDIESPIVLSEKIRIVLDRLLEFN